MKEHAWQEEPCGSFREEVEKKIERERKVGGRINGKINNFGRENRGRDEKNLC